MENEEEFLEKLVRLSKQNIIAKESLTSNFANKKKKELDIKGVYNSTKQEIYDMLKEISPQDRQSTFDYLENKYQYMLGLCERNKCSSSNMFDMFAFLSLKMFSIKNIQPLYYNHMLDQFAEKASNALWCSSEEDYRLASKQIKDEIDCLDAKDKDNFDKLLSIRADNSKEAYYPLSEEEYSLFEHKQRAYKLLKCLSEYSNEERNAQYM